MNLQQAINVFCPTGEGGGIDPTCSPGGAYDRAMRGRTEIKQLHEEGATMSSHSYEVGGKIIDAWGVDDAIKEHKGKVYIRHPDGSVSPWIWSKGVTGDISGAFGDRIRPPKVEVTRDVAMEPLGSFVDKEVATVEHAGEKYTLSLKANKTSRGGYNVMLKPSKGGKSVKLTSLSEEYTLGKALEFVRDFKLVKGSTVTVTAR